MTYLEADTLYVPMGGETCAPNPPRSECESALDELARLHFSYINADYHPEVVASWEAGGCLDEITNKLGYRFVLRDAELPAIARPGGWFGLELNLDNVGWAAPYNPRPVELILDGPGGRWVASVARAEVDPRRWAPGSHTLSGALLLPSDAEPGSYQLGLALPAASPGLAQIPEYAIATANVGAWSEGVNWLGTIELAEDGPGDALAGQDFEFVP